MFAMLGCVAVLACTGEQAPSDPVDPNDLDGDGIPNDEDLCPRSSDIVQHDEDADGIGDACDVCPAISDPMQGDAGEIFANQFEDGVGDACDPRRSFTGDELVAFHSFVDDSGLGTWRGDGWTIADDAVHATASATWQHATAHVGDGLLASIRVDSVTWQASDARIIVGVDAIDGSLGHTCAIVRDRDLDGFDELESTVFATTQTKSLGTAVTGSVTLSVWRLIDRERIGRVICRAVIGNRVDEIELAGDDSTTGRYGFSSTGADTTLSSVAVYTFPINPCVSVARCAPGS